MASSGEFITALRAYAGVPYLRGGGTRAGLDCSGLIVAALADVGIDWFPRHSADQIAACAPISVEEAKRTPGALLYRPGHDGISTGSGVIESRTPVVVEGAWSDTYDGGKTRWTRAGLVPGITYTASSTTTEGSNRMISPAQGRVSSEFSPARKHPITGKVQMHAGIDIANSTGTPIYAAYAGTVEKTGPAVVAGRTGLGILIRNPDGERQYYGHLSVSSVKVGQSVAKGERIGSMGATGNVTGPHLHFETWNKAGTPVNPRIHFNHHGVTPGSKPTGTSGSSSSSSSSKSDAKTLAYQKRQNRYGGAGLVEDGINGAKTKAWRAWVKTAQTALNAFKVTWPRKKLRVDGDYGSTTANYVGDVQKRNGLVRDRILGPVMIRWMRSKGAPIPNRP